LVRGRFSPLFLSGSSAMACCQAVVCSCSTRRSYLERNWDSYWFDYRKSAKSDQSRRSSPVLEALHERARLFSRGPLAETKTSTGDRRRTATTTTKIITTARPLPPTSTTGRWTCCRRLPVDNHTPTSGYRYGDTAYVERVKEDSLSSGRMME
jgi:hypothetical protein